MCGATSESYIKVRYIVQCQSMFTLRITQLPAAIAPAKGTKESLYKLVLYLINHHFTLLERDNSSNQ